MENNKAKTRILFVCMGNICRSPTAEAVARRRAEIRGTLHLEFDSAGTHDYHIGDAPDVRAIAAGARRGYDLSPLRARQVAATDFSRFDQVLAMDANNLAALQRLCPSAHRSRLGRLLDYTRERHMRDVPDPYYGGDEGFEQVLDLVEEAVDGLLLTLAKK